MYVYLKKIILTLTHYNALILFFKHKVKREKINVAFKVKIW